MEIDRFHAGALRTRLVSRLSGASQGQLRGWHRSGAIQASIRDGGRGRLRLYSWVDYCKARAARKLLEQGLPTRSLIPNLLQLDQEVEDWYRLPLLSYQSHVIVPIEGQSGYTIIDKQRAMAGLIRAADRAIRPAGALDVDDLLSVVSDLQREGPLGQLSEFGALVTMDPGICEGYPTLIGTRIETAHVAAIHRKGFQNSSEIASRYRVQLDQVNAAIEFESALAA